MIEKRKVTVVLSKKTLDDAMEYTGLNITDKLIEGLKLLLSPEAKKNLSEKYPELMLDKKFRK